MIKVNDYFDGKVKSLGFFTTKCPATVGVMAPGEYEFGTSTVEHMTVVSGLMTIQLPNETAWKDYKPFETFIVPKDSRFKLKIPVETAYLCLYR